MAALAFYIKWNFDVCYLVRVIMEYPYVVEVVL